MCRVRSGKRASRLRGCELVAVCSAKVPLIQNDTVYAAGVSAHVKNLAGAQALLQALHSEAAAALLERKGMEPAAAQ